MVGSGTAAPEPDRVCSGYWLDARDVRLLLDCGPGVVHHLARFALSWQRISHLALTHFHNDHIGDVPMLFFALRHGTEPGRGDPLTVIGPAGTRGLLRDLARVFGDHVSDPGFPVEVIEVRDGDAVALSATSRLSAARTPHTVNSLAYRVETLDGAIGYTGDTGYSEEVARFLMGAELLVAECSLPDERAIDSHLTPSRLARMAAVASPELLVPTHMYPQIDQTALPAVLAAAGWGGRTHMAFDGLSFGL